ncbi:hypothetical protein [Flavobacterium sp.]|jgi:hypothetical protein|uniref:hypothetical protein n=1 Tax=Flavobacterium sp. TaxID=239 RepID=UPI0037BF5C65
MKREYFGMLFLLLSVALILMAYYLFSEEIVTAYLSRFVIIWLLVAFYAGQYSMKFPKAF